MRETRAIDLGLPCSPAIIEASHHRLPGLERQLAEKDALIDSLRQRIAQLDPGGLTTSGEW